jgi:hypothetical protein
MHGAALSWALFLREDAMLVEMIPPEYMVRPHFRYFSAWSGRAYHAIAIGHQDVVTQDFTVDVEHIKQQMIGALHSLHANRLQWATNRLDKLGVILPQLPDPTKAPPPTEAAATTTAAVATTLGSEAPSTRPPKDWTDLGKSPSGHRLCLIVPFRDSASKTSQGANRTANLHVFVPYLLDHLSKSGKQIGRDFEIVVVEQTQGAVFNKGALFNAGYFEAKDDCDYFCLHDVDQLPESPQNTYDFPDSPTHLCTASSQFGYRQAYFAMVGGALLITAEQFKKMNGYSNFYWGWGQEDDDFFFRLERTFGRIDRAPPDKGRYRALQHPRVMDLDVTPRFNKGTKHLRDTQAGAVDIQTDGLSNLKYHVVSEKRPRLGYRHLLIQLDFEDMPVDLQHV